MAHTERGTWDCAIGVFLGTVTSCSSDIAWPTRYPDLSAPDHFLCGHMTAKPRILEELQEHITGIISVTDTGLLQVITANFWTRLHICIVYIKRHVKRQSDPVTGPVWPRE